MTFPEQFIWFLPASAALAVAGYWPIRQHWLSLREATGLTEPRSAPPDYSEGNARSFYGRTDEQGNLVFVLFDCSDFANDMFGNDVATHLVISAENKTDFVSRVLGISAREIQRTYEDDWAINAVLNRLPSFGAMEAWLKENGYPYHREFDSWA